MTLLSITQSVALRVMKQSISSAATNADSKVLQMVELINEAGQELAARHTWQLLNNEATFASVATESQGLLTTLAGADFSFIVNETFWNRTQRRPVFGPKSEAEWQQLKAQFTQGPWTQYRIRANQLLFFPIPPAGNNIYFEWMSKNWATDATGVTGKASMNVDTDISKLNERLLVLDGIWRWKMAQKLDFEDDFTKAQVAINDAIGREGSRPILNLTGAIADIAPGVIVPAGNWLQ